MIFREKKIAGNKILKKLFKSIYDLPKAVFDEVCMDSMFQATSRDGLPQFGRLGIPDFNVQVIFKLPF